MVDISSHRAEGDAAAEVIHRADYMAPAFQIDRVDLEFDLAPTATRVKARMAVRRERAGAPLVLNGQDMELRALAIDGVALPPEAYAVDADSLTIWKPPAAAFELTLETRIDPAANTALEGLYVSRGLYCTQCEAEGFRKIVYFLDRPDVMARYRVRINADRGECPLLLSNGNLVESGDLGEGRHFAVWDDPFPKPSYLFALVAGNLGHMEDRFTTRSGRAVTLRIYAEERDLDKCDHAMASLKASMRWDEEVFGLEYDLDIYNIVAVSDFNMGAMENKSLNVFNTKCVLAKAETATDADFAAVEGVIAHEYFHNWTGNRVTCRDWFQLSLKEGLTVFRDQEFSADQGSRAVKRIDDVRLLRAHQFPEDAGPMAHPVRPDSYIEINNFYTATVYEKGAEIIRMMYCLLGADGFRKGMDLYFARHDGEAVTCDDFVAAMETATGADLAQFRRWYAEAGTPVIEVARDYDEKTREFRLTLRQTTPPTPGQSEKNPLHIPVLVGLMDPRGANLSFILAGNEGGPADASGNVLLNLRAAEQTFVFTEVATAPIPSILRNFSAPVRLKLDLSRDELRFLMAHDSDAFNRWEAGQRLSMAILLDLVAAVGAGRTLALAPEDIAAFAQTLGDAKADPALIAETLALPTENDIAGEMAVVEVEAIHTARDFMRRSLGQALAAEFCAVYEHHQDGAAYRYSGAAVAARRLKNLALSYLMAEPDAAAVALALRQLTTADNMTDEITALRLLAHGDRPERDEALAAFYDKWQANDLVIDKWFSTQATAPEPAALDRIVALAEHPAFTLKNPNRVRALVGAFAQLNPTRFHDASGRGYRFLREQVAALDKLNPQVAARILAPLGRWQRYDSARQAMMKGELEALLAMERLSRDVYEVVAKSLGRS